MLSTFNHSHQITITTQLRIAQKFHSTFKEHFAVNRDADNSTFASDKNIVGTKVMTFKGTEHVRAYVNLHLKRSNLTNKIM
jgi:hypothetical protein